MDDNNQLNKLNDLTNKLNSIGEYYEDKLKKLNISNESYISKYNELLNEMENNINEIKT